MTKICSVMFCLLMVTLVHGQKEGEDCVFKSTNKPGLCLNIEHCDYAKGQIKSRQKPQLCGGFVNKIYPIVCCPMPRSEIECLKYYKPETNILFVAFGNKSLAKEFPHMAALGFGDEDNINWSCGGSLITDQIVLTAAHCINSRDFGTVRWVRLGDLDIADTKDDAQPQNFTVSEIIVHPNYKPPSHYHDVALLKLDRAAEFNSYVSPACLHFNRSIPDDLIVTGWGKVDFFGESSSHLLKAVLLPVDQETCRRSYSSVSKKKLPNGISDDQVCAGHPQGRDACPGDSGGPLQYKSNRIPVHYYVVGVTSFGKACGLEDSVGVYARVSQYVSWIESVVWPS